MEAKSTKTDKRQYGKKGSQMCEIWTGGKPAIESSSSKTTKEDDEKGWEEKLNIIRSGGKGGGAGDGRLVI